jgi:proline racemase
MRPGDTIHVVDSHTEGMPTRVVTRGFVTLPGSDMLARRAAFEAEHDHLRTFLMFEPRGHAAMSGAILQPPTRPDADVAVLFIEVSGCLAMCGHGTIGVATVLVEERMVPVTEPVTRVRLEVPAGLVIADVEVVDGRVRAVTITNVPSFVHATDVVVDVPGHGPVVIDVAFGGNFYALIPAERLGIPLEPAREQDLIRTGLAVIATGRRLRGGWRTGRRARGDRHPSGLDRPLAVRHRHVGPTGPAAPPRRAGAGHALHPRVVHRLPLRGPDQRNDHGRGSSRHRADDPRARLDQRTR